MKVVSWFFICLGLGILIFTFGPVVYQELNYQFNQLNQITYQISENPTIPEKSENKNIKYLTPVSTDFGLVIPKIGVNARVFPQVDPTDPEQYLPKLKLGVAQASGSAYPNQKSGNIFLFAHSTDAFYNVAHYNAVFFLLAKLDQDDEIDLFYQGQRYYYRVTHKAVVQPEKLADYIAKNTSGQTLTLQTCYPPGTTIKRLLVIAKLKS